MSVKFAVVTKTDDGDKAVNFDVYLETEQPNERNGYRAQHKPLHEVVGDPRIMLAIRTPVWTLGEILVMGPDGRELDGMERKPDKWSVTVEEFDDIEAAVARSREVRQRDL